MKWISIVIGLPCAFVVGWSIGGYSASALLPAIVTVIIAALNGSSFTFSVMAERLARYTSDFERLFLTQQEEIEKLNRRIEVGYDEEGS